MRGCYRKNKLRALHLRHGTPPLGVPERVTARTPNEKLLLGDQDVRCGMSTRTAPGAAGWFVMTIRCARWDDTVAGDGRADDAQHARGERATRRAAGWPDPDRWRRSDDRRRRGGRAARRIGRGQVDV